MILVLDAAFKMLRETDNTESLFDALFPLSLIKTETQMYTPGFE